MLSLCVFFFFFFSSRRRHTRFDCDWSSDVCSSDLAHAIHAASARTGGPFVTVNIAAVPDALLEAEFFGVAPGAYTGADRKPRDGKFRLADEIGRAHV